MTAYIFMTNRTAVEEGHALRTMAESYKKESPAGLFLQGSLFHFDPIPDTRL